MTAPPLTDFVDVSSWWTIVLCGRYEMKVADNCQYSVSFFLCSDGGRQRQDGSERTGRHYSSWSTSTFGMSFAIHGEAMLWISLQSRLSRQIWPLFSCPLREIDHETLIVSKFRGRLDNVMPTWRYFVFVAAEWAPNSISQQFVRSVPINKTNSLLPPPLFFFPLWPCLSVKKGPIPFSRYSRCGLEGDRHIIVWIYLH